MKKLAGVVYFDVFALMLLGLVLVMSASSTYSSVKFEDTFYLFNAHVTRILIGILLMSLTAFLPFELYKDYSRIILIGSIILLAYTLAAAPSINGAGRWINLGVVSFQPADLARLALLIHLSNMLVEKKEMLSNYKHGFLKLFVWVGLVAVLILLQPNLSNAFLIVFLSLVLMFVGGAKLKHIAATTAPFILLGGSAAMIYSHSRERILGFLTSLFQGGEVNHQVTQAMVGLGSGGFFGVGLGFSKQNNLFLPEAYGDFIFAILGEELGFLGAVLVLVAFLLFFIAGILIAKKATDPFAKLLAFGITISVITYAFVNISVASGVLPTTGLPLPFISYGGTSIFFTCISVGMLINIAISSSKEENPEEVEEE
ncbi:MAG: FtsW/RodA/SpoVE family cell cycle protein [Ignavibacteriaceae bacterium]|nr:FtsW/RodA/SpoVE family cell cycle protein [Ignavibacteriaceae bacterium]